MRQICPLAARSLAALTLSLVALGVTRGARADEGMWPYNMAPIEQVEERYGFEMTPAWLGHAMQASVRFNNGGSGSFVSKKGLVMTNHHVGADCIHKLGNTAGNRDFMKEGFYAEAPVDEPRCPDLELNRLTAIDDVTGAVRAAADEATGEVKQNEARNAEIARLEQACAEATRGRCDVVTLYAGDAYHLYKYQKFTDVRLVFAPELQAAFFGGDPDNFTYPRHALDVAFFRVYQDEKPLDTEHYLPFSAEGAQEGDLVFVSGHPGSTDRFAPTAKLTLLRDTVYPFVLGRLKAEREVLLAYTKRGEAPERAARDDLFSVENSIKALTGYLAGLEDEALLREATAREAKVLAGVHGLKDLALKERLLEAWPRLEQAYRAYGALYERYAVTERGFGPLASTLASRARHLQRLADEQPKDSGKRLKEYRDSQRQSLELSLLSKAPLDEGLEIEKLALGLQNLRDVLGAQHEAVRAMLAGKEPRARAAELIRETALKDPAEVKRLYDLSPAALQQAKDPLLTAMRALDPVARRLRARYEAEVEAVEREHAGRTAEAWAHVFGTSLYPDATFTLRINPGVVKGYHYAGEEVSWRTQLGDLYLKHKRNGGQHLYQLPQRFIDAMPRVDFTIPYNFVSTNDIIGGNSGSPVFNQEGHVVGLVFDGNLPQLPNRFLYRQEAARAVSVHTKGILHALERVYGAKSLIEELLPPRTLGQGS